MIFSRVMRQFQTEKSSFLSRCTRSELLRGYSCAFVDEMAEFFHGGRQRVMNVSRMRPAMGSVRLLVHSLSVLLLLCSCGPALKKSIMVGASGTQEPPLAAEYRINAGDRLAVKFFYNADLNQEVVVRPDGRISLQLVQEVMAAGRTPSELTEELTTGYSKHLEQPEITVIVNAFGGQLIYVGGEVGTPGLREIGGPTTALQAITASGGFRDTARKEEVAVIRRGPEDKPFIIALNLEKAMDGTDLSQDIYLVPYDTVLVPKTNIADVNTWTQQYIGNTLAPFNPFWSWYLMLR